MGGRHACIAHAQPCVLPNRACQSSISRACVHIDRTNAVLGKPQHRRRVRQRAHHSRHWRRGAKLASAPLSTDAPDDTAAVATASRSTLRAHSMFATDSTFERVSDTATCAPTRESHKSKRIAQTHAHASCRDRRHRTHAVVTIDAQHALCVRRCINRFCLWNAPSQHASRDAATRPRHRAHDPPRRWTQPPLRRCLGRAAAPTALHRRSASLRQVVRQRRPLQLPRRLVQWQAARAIAGAVRAVPRAELHELRQGVR